MPVSPDSLFDDVCKHVRQTCLLATTGAVLDWDERTKMPSANAEYRAEQTTLLSGLTHQRWTDDAFVAKVAELAASGAPGLTADADDGRAVTIRRIKRQVDKKTKLPRSLVEELTRTSVLGQSAWEKARRENNFAHFLPWLARTFELKRQQADALGYKTCRYDALLDEYEPEEVTSNVARVLADLREKLVPLVSAIAASKRCPDVSLLAREFPVDAQEAFGKEAAAAAGFEFDRGRIDVTAHPFCTTLGPHDCRITTRYDKNFFNAAFFGTLHEAGHGIYEQGLPPDEFGLPLGEAISLGIHESQSRMWENLVGRSRAFWRHFYPAAQARFPARRRHQRRRVLLRHQRRSSLVDPHRGRRGDVQPAHTHPLRAGAGPAFRRPCRGRRPGGVERQIPPVPWNCLRDRRRRRDAGRSLERGIGGLFPDILAG